MASVAEKILTLSDHPKAREVADHIASGHSFGEVLAKYNLSKATLKNIHYLKSSIETAIKGGKPFEQVIDEHFENKGTAKLIMAAYHKHQAKFGKS